MKKLIIVLLFIFSATTAHGAWETTGNALTAGEFIGTTNNSPVPFRVNNVPKAQFDVDGLRFLQPLAWISDSNGQVFLDHLAGGGTALFAYGGTRIVNLTTNGVEIIGPLIAKNKYRVATTPTDTVTATDYTVECLPGGMENLPAIAGTTGKHYEFINPYTQTCTVLANGLETIGNTNPEPKLKLQAGESAIIVSNGSIWRIVAVRKNQ